MRFGVYVTLMQSTAAPVRFGLTGLGGHAAYVCDQLLAESRSGRPSAELVAVADPALDRFPCRIAELRAQGVKVFGHFHDLLAQPIDAVWLPLPIDLHLPFTEQALAAGKSV